MEDCLMYSNNSNRSRAALARGFMALWAVLALGLGLMASPAEAAPFAYVPNNGYPGTVSVIDTATNQVVATVPLAVNYDEPFVVAVTPDGKHAYVVNYPSYPENVSVIDTASNTVVATVPLVAYSSPEGIAFTPDGKHAYVANGQTDTVSVIDTASNTVVGAPIVVGSLPLAVAITPDGKHAYVVNWVAATLSVIATASNTVVEGPITVTDEPVAIAITPDGKHAYVAGETSVVGTVSVVTTATNTVMATIQVGQRPNGLAFTPDGKYVYVANSYDGSVSVIATASNTVVATVPVGSGPSGVAVTPDGKHVYVTNSVDNNVSVIRTATNMVVGFPIQVGVGPSAVGIVPPPPGVPFLAFSATALDIAFGAAPNQDSFNLHSQFTLSSTAPGLHPHRDPVTLSVGTFSITIPPGSIREQPDGSFFFAGVINGVSLKARITPTATLQYAFHAKAQGVSLTGTTNTVYATLIISGDSGATSVTATISH
jgi:YVTN family beta-propeller protein